MHFLFLQLLWIFLCCRGYFIFKSQQIRTGDRKTIAFARRNYQKPSAAYLQFLHAVRNKEVAVAIDQFNKLKEETPENYRIGHNSYAALFHLFHKADHLSAAEKFFDDYLKQGNPNESVLLAMLRCYSDAGDTANAFKMFVKLFGSF
jgi:hypothetical protein